MPRIEGTQRVYVPLSNAEHEALMAALRKRLPRNHRFDPLDLWYLSRVAGEVRGSLRQFAQGATGPEREGYPSQFGYTTREQSPGKDTLLRIAVEGGLRVLPLREEEDLRSERSEWRRTLPPVPPPQHALLQGLTVPRNLTWLQDPPTPRPRDHHDFYYASGSRSTRNRPMPWNVCSGVTVPGQSTSKGRSLRSTALQKSAGHLSARSMQTIWPAPLGRRYPSGLPSRK